MRIQVLAIAVLIGLFSVSCKKKKAELGVAPAFEDAEFTYAPSAESPNIIQFTAAKSGSIIVWDFGNGTAAKGKTARAIYPLKGSYLVKITVFTKGGSVTMNKEITIAEDDLTLLGSPDIVNLTGGISGLGFKTWVIDSSRDGHFGVGPNPASAAGLVPEYYFAKAFEQREVDMYNDRYTFYLEGFSFDMTTKGVVFIDDLAVGDYPGSYPSPADNYNAPLEDQLNENWNIVEEDGIKYLSTTGKSFIGFYAGTRTYQILKLSENELSLVYVDANATLLWYLRLVPLGYAGIVDTGDGSGPVEPADTNTFALPIDFEIIKPIVTPFGESTDSIITNPFKSGIDSSNFVLETKKGIETWAGLFINHKGKLDFTTKKSISLKVYAPKTGDFMIKLEDKASKNTIIKEMIVPITKANEWVEISADFSSTSPGLYDRITLIPAWNDSNAGTFYIDDIEQK
ncbi:MAG: PKD domain-containing protein [Salibacteraceae bacterium]|nr:PKD domain-containing protein [Salibacteraceae bacterium]|tara:strand:+ start:9783 stop:11150 length:1368 start_codon:yes stop_codon:yes gene_type:complete